MKLPFRVQTSTALGPLAAMALSLAGFAATGQTTSGGAATQVAGRVTDLDGKPIAGACLMIRSWESGPPYASKSRTGVDGEFTLEAQPGNSRLFVYADGHASMYRTNDVLEGVNRGWDFLLPQSAHVSGRITDTHGNPAAKRTVELWEVRTDCPPSPPGTSYFLSGGEGADTTGNDGHFDMPNVTPGKHRVIVYRSAPSADRNLQQIPVRGRFLDVEAGERYEHVEIVMNPPEDFALAGQVRDRDGNPVRGIGVDTFIPHGRHWWTNTGNDGAYYLDGLDGMGRSTFRLIFNGVTGADDYRLVIPAAPLNAQHVDLVLPGTCVLEGTVANATTGEDITAYELTIPQVTLPDCGAVWTEPRVHMAQSPKGAFTVTGVPAGEITVEIRASGLGAQRFTVTGETGKAVPLACRMAGPAVFAGRTTLNGHPEKTTMVINGSWRSSGDDGRFQFDNYPNGDLLVWFFKHDGWHRTAEVHLVSGETTQLDMEMGGSAEIRGTVTFPDDEEKFCTIRLAAKPAPDGWPESGRPGVEEHVLTYAHVRKSGSTYRLQNIPAGTWVLMAGRYRPSMHRSLLGASQVVELRKNQTLRVNFDLSEKTSQ